MPAGLGDFKGDGSPDTRCLRHGVQVRHDDVHALTLIYEGQHGGERRAAAHLGDGDITIHIGFFEAETFSESV
ncbi:hypothetical protein CgIS1_05730 [Frankia sp. CgS1]|nr:hypothetical protein CgIS1_05730 [Frankia sp. CgIS1]